MSRLNRILYGEGYGYGSYGYGYGNSYGDDVKSKGKKHRKK